MKINGNYFVFLMFRIFVSMFIIRNYDHPDQYWQGPQIAHKIVYGYGYQTWEWTMNQPIRSPIYPLILSIGYWIINFFKDKVLLSSISQDFLIGIMPWIINSFIAALGDYYLFKLLKFYYGKSPSIQTILIIYLNWFYLANTSRTYINSLQTCLTMIGFYYWNIRQNQKINDLISRFIVFLCYNIRPTSIVFWIAVWPYQLLIMLFYKKSMFSIIKFITKNIIQILIMIGGSLITSYLWFNKLQLTQYNFIKYNMIYGWSSLFGKHQYYTYFLILPIILFSNSILWILSKVFHQNIYLSNYQNQSKQKYTIKKAKLGQLLLLTVQTLLILSFSQHKQMRYILVLIPFFMIYLSSVIQKCQIKKSLKTIILILIVLNLFISLSYDCIGRTGGTQVLQKLRGQIDNLNQTNKNLIILGQPHALPLYCILHRNIQIGIPDSSAIKKAQKLDQADLLTSNPLKLYNILKVRAKIQNYPRFIIIQQKFKDIIFQNLQETLQIKYQLIGNYQNIRFLQKYFTNNHDGYLLYKLKDKIQ